MQSALGQSDQANLVAPHEFLHPDPLSPGNNISTHIQISVGGSRTENLSFVDGKITELHAGARWKVRARHTRLTRVLLPFERLGCGKG